MTSETTVKVRKRKRRRHHKNKNKLSVPSVEVSENGVIDNLKDIKRQKLKSHEEKISKYYKTLEKCDKKAVPVSSIDEILPGSIIYFRKNVLKRSRPKLSALKKAKVFFKMKRDQNSAGPDSILFRVFKKFNLGWPADWSINCSENNLSTEPFIMNFMEMHSVCTEMQLTDKEKDLSCAPLQNKVQEQ